MSYFRELITFYLCHTREFQITGSRKPTVSVSLKYKTESNTTVIAQNTLLYMRKKNKMILSQEKLGSFTKTTKIRVTLTRK